MQRAILGTPRLVAVMWGPDDAGLIHELHSTIETTRYLSGTAPWSREKAEERLRNWFGEQERDGATKYKILSRDDGRFIGRAGFSLLGGERQDFELGYSLRFQEWGKGFATEVARALIDWFSARNMGRLIAFTHPDNHASQHVLRKAGMRQIAPRHIDGFVAPTFEVGATNSNS
jgi:RimJ/RimL family protein N-acetyltransferase